MVPRLTFRWLWMSAAHQMIDSIFVLASWVVTGHSITCHPGRLLLCGSQLRHLISILFLFYFIISEAAQSWINATSRRGASRNFAWFYFSGDFLGGTLYSPRSIFPLGLCSPRFMFNQVYVHPYILQGLCSPSSIFTQVYICF